MLAKSDIDPVGRVRPESSSNILIVCEHAGNELPMSLGNLGLRDGELQQHIGWDIGALGVAEALANRLNAPLYYQNYSRLVIDCNRPLTSTQLIVDESDRIAIPGNVNVNEEERLNRINSVWRPFQEAVAEALDSRKGNSMMLVAVHSFSPVYMGERRPLDIGLLYNRDSTLATLLDEQLVAIDDGLVVGMNEPYAVDDADDYTIPEFGEKRGIPHVLLEIRNDHIETTEQQRRWADILAIALQRCESQVS